MQPLDPPDRDLWHSRSAWFWRAHDANAGPHALDLSPRAQALLTELEAVYCVGAWSAAMMLAWAIIEGEQRAGRAAEAAPDIDWLRERRNALAHVSATRDEDMDERQLESIAQGAVRIAFKTLFAAAWR